MLSYNKWETCVGSGVEVLINRDEAMRKSRVGGNAGYPHELSIGRLRYPIKDAAAICPPSRGNLEGVM